MADPKMRGRQGSDAGPAGNGKQFSRFRLYLDTRRKALLAALVLLVLIVSNYLVQRSYERLDRDIKSIYEDRLLPSHYLFQLQSLLLQKKLIQEHGELQTAQRQEEIRSFDQQIDSLVRAYNKTYLTTEEAKEWKMLQQTLQEYDSLETSIMRSSTAEGFTHYAAIDTAFQQSLRWLAQLNQLQTKEGKHLRKAGRVRIQNALLQSYIRITMVVILLTLGVSLIVASRPPGGGKELYN